MHGSKLARWRTGVLLALALLSGTGAGAVRAQQAPWQPAGGFVDLGRSSRDTTIVGAGLRWPWDWQAVRWGGQFSAATELSVSYWSAKTFGSGRERQAQLALVPLLRWRFGQGASPWFLEGGIGLSLHQRRYEAEDIRMSTRWNFYDVLAVGRSIGAGHELSLRAVHVSNASIRKPNPGADILMLRWAARF